MKMVRTVTLALSAIVLLGSLGLPTHARATSNMPPPPPPEPNICKEPGIHCPNSQ